MSDEFTVGVEEEFQIIDPETRDLKSRIQQLIEAKTPLDEVNLMPELHESVVEVATPVCKDIDEVRRAVVCNRKTAAEIANHGSSGATGASDPNCSAAPASASAR